VTVFGKEFGDDWDIWSMQVLTTYKVTYPNYARSLASIQNREK
jgi:hypothetical protein